MRIKKILVSQPKPASEKSPYDDLEKKHGVEVVFRPLFKVEGLSSKDFRQQKITISDYTAVIFTARTAIDHYFRLAKELRFDVPDTMKYFCISETIAHYLQKYIIYRKRKIFYSENGHADGLMPFIEKHKKEKFLYPVSSAHESKLPQLEEKNINFQRAIMFRTVSNNFQKDEVFDFDMVAFFTPTGVKVLASDFPDLKDRKVAIAAMGPNTIEEINQQGLQLDVTISPEAPSMAAAIDKYLEKQAKEDKKDEKVTVKKTATKKSAPKKTGAKK